MLSGLPSPADLDLPPKFVGWRPEQEDALWRATGTTHQHAVLGLPTGSGKSLVALALARLTGLRTLILTSTKGLSDQYSSDFGKHGLTDIRGMNNYTCRALMPDGAYSHLASQRGGVGCDRGPCLAKLPCDLREIGCTHYDQVQRAREAQVVCTNYSYWIHQQMGVRYRQGECAIGEFDLIILDEAHDAPDELCNVLALEIEADSVALVGLRMPVEPKAELWKVWAKQNRSVVDGAVAMAEQDVKLSGGSQNAVRTLLDLRALQQKMGRLATIEGQWAVEVEATVAKLSPVWPSEYAEWALWPGAESVVLMSATITPKTAELLGVKNFAWAEYESSFPARRRPVFQVPTVTMNFRTSESELRVWAARISQIIRGRSDRKGIVHTVSYKRMQFLLDHLDVGDVPVFSHTSATTRGIVEKFKRAERGVIISPSLSTGYDFPYSQCRYQVIGKVPWPDTRGAVMEARKKRDKEYAAYIAAQQIVQMAGRGMRAADDLSETFITDDFFRAMLASYRHLFPRWFLDAVRSAPVIPAAPDLD